MDSTPSEAASGVEETKVEQTDEEQQALQRNTLTVEAKVVLVGEIYVGKTALCRRFHKDVFDNKVQPSVGVAYCRASLRLQRTVVNLNLWDTAGQERFRAVNSLYYRDAAAAIVVFDVTNRDSFRALDYWMRELKKNAPKDMIIFVAGNKADCTEARVVSVEEAEAFAKKYRVMYSDTSAKSGLNVQQVFRRVANEGMKRVHSGYTVKKKNGDGEVVEENRPWSLFKIAKVERDSVDVSDISNNGSSDKRSCC